MKTALAFAVALSLASAASAAAAAEPDAGLLPVESYTLPNGLEVVFHLDRSDPVVAVVLAAHVGSAREKPGRTGFAHLFEHLFFLDSENVGQGGVDKLSARVGGSGAAGGTNRDWTIYHQEVPSDALEKMLWAEADKLGWFINTVTAAVVDKERQVVKNEKRQRVDNVPYGHTSTIILETLYPEGHPYRWPVIGSLADLDAASLEDVREFYRRWYVPNNATLVVAGDFDPKQARRWVERYFGEIARGDAVERAKPMPVAIEATRSVFIEDSFAPLPELTLVWPSVGMEHEDSWPLQVLLDLLADGKDTPLHRTLVDELELTDEVGGAQNSHQIAGETMLRVRAFEGIDLDRVRAAIDAGLARFEREGVDDEALARAKTVHEKSFFDAIESVEDKALLIARYDVYAGRPDFVDEDLARLRAVDADDVLRVYRTYVADRPHVATSVVPSGKRALALEGAVAAKIVEEAIVAGAEQEFDTSRRAEFERTPSKIDRTVEPPAGAAPVVRVPTPWTRTLDNGLVVSGIESRELPIARFALSLDGGRLLDDPAKPGGASLLARMLTRGTKHRTPAELENDLEALGAAIDVIADDERFVFTGSTLARHFDATIAILEEMLLEPRWDATELALSKSAAISELKSNRAEPEILAERILAAAIHGEGHVLAKDPLGDEASVAALSMDDLRALHARMAKPDGARFRVVGDVTGASVAEALASLAEGWPRARVELPARPAPKAPARAVLWFHDVPDAKQSVLAFGAPALRRADPEFHAATVMNFILGGGGFASRLIQTLREGKGYTYSIHSGYSGGRSFGTFEVVSPVRSNVTLEAAQLVRTLVADYGRTFTEEDLAVTKAFLTKSRARSFETTGDKLGMLALIGDYGLPADYVAREGRTIEAMTVERIRELAAKHLVPGRMHYVVVGDAKTQRARLDALGLGEPRDAKALLDSTRADAGATADDRRAARVSLSSPR